MWAPPPPGGTSVLSAADLAGYIAGGARRAGSGHRTARRGYQRVIPGRAPRARTLRAMSKRILAAFLWFFAGWYLGAFIAFLVGVPDVLGTDHRRDVRGAHRGRSAPGASGRPARAGARRPAPSRMARDWSRAAGRPTDSPRRKHRRAGTVAGTGPSVPELRNGGGPVRGDLAMRGRLSQSRVTSTGAPCSAPKGRCTSITPHCPAACCAGVHSPTVSGSDLKSLRK